MSEIYLPLRSNGAWFARSGARNELVQRVKNALVFYDDIGIEDGTYQATVGERNSSDWLIPPGAGIDRSRVVYYEEGGDFRLSMRPSGSTGPMQPIFQDKSAFSYRADFYPILEEGGLLDVPFVHRLHVQLRDDAKRTAELAANRALDDEGLKAVLPENRWLKKIVMKGLFTDAAVALALGVPFMVDHHCGAAIEFEIAQAVGEWSEDVRERARASLVAVGLPDFGREPWHEVLRVRESLAGKELRKVADRVAQELLVAQGQGASAADLADLARNAIAAELVGEVTRRQPTFGSVLLNLGLNLLGPAGATISSGKDALDLSRSRRNWVSLLRPQ